jgi:NADH-quinone oxidoreductase subunit N
MTAGAFAVLLYLHADDRPVETVDDLAGVGQSHPLAGLCLAVALLSMIGLPLTAGFSGKLLLFLAAFKAPPAGGLGEWYRVLAVVMAVNAAVGAVYYLRLLGAMYLRAPLKPVERTGGWGPLAAAVVCTVGTVALGVYPRPLAEAVRAAAPAKPAAAPAK